MDRVKKVVFSFLNSGEGYFHTKRIIEDGFKQPRDLYGPMTDRPEKWDYTDIRDITKDDLKNLVNVAFFKIDHDLFQIIPSTALNASLQYAIHTFDNGRFQSKIDAVIYDFLLKLLKEKLICEGI